MNLGIRIRQHKFIILDISLILCVLTVSQLFAPPENMGEIGSSVQQLIRQFPEITDFRLSSDAKTEVELVQRVTEMFWPRRWHEDSKHLITLVSEDSPPGCVVKATYARIKYAFCL